MSKAERPQKPNTANMSELGVMQLQSEQAAAQANWERAILEELEAWHRAGDKIGIRDPNLLWGQYERTFENSRLRVIDKFAMSIRESGTSSGNWDLIYAEAEQAWNARQRFIEKGNKKDGTAESEDVGTKDG
jgi:hypothetical protein